MSLLTDSAAARRPRRERARTPAARRKRAQRARHLAGFHHYSMWIGDRAVEGLILKCILEGRLTEAQALRPRLVAQAIAALLEEEGNRWAR
jgi:hypothetical protein